MSGTTAAKRTRNGMLAEYLEREKTFSYRALMSGHAVQDYYLDRFVSQPGRWKGESLPAKPLRKMQCRNVFMIVFDNAVFLPTQLYRHFNSLAQSYLSDFFPAQPRARALAATGMLVLMLCLVNAITQECFKLEYSAATHRQKTKTKQLATALATTRPRYR